MIPYFIVFILLLFIKKQKNNNLYFIILLIFTIIRYDVGWDYRWYYHLATRYEFHILPLSINKNNVFNFVSLFDWEVWQFYRMEFLNKVFYKIIWYFKLPAQTIVILYGTITLFFIKKGLDYKKIYSSNVWLFFYCFPLFLSYFFSIMRQGIAVSIIFYGYKYIEEKKFFKYLMIVIFASLFHKTALLMIILYFINKISINKYIYLLCLPLIFYFNKIFLLLVTTINIPVISNYKNYVLNSIGEGGTKIYYIILCIYISLIFLIFIIEKFYENNRFFIKVVMSGCFIYLSLIKFGHLSIRMSIYFLIFILYLIPFIEKLKILNKFFYNKNLNALIISFILFILLNLILLNDLKSERNAIVPYKVIFISNKDNFDKYFNY